MLDLSNPVVSRTWRERTGQMKTWAATPKEGLVRLIGPAVVGIRRWNKEWVRLVMDLAQDRQLLFEMLNMPWMPSQPAPGLKYKSVSLFYQTLQGEVSASISRRLACYSVGNQGVDEMVVHAA